MYDLIIIGGGPAGLTAAIYAIRKRINVLVLTKDLGGKTNYHLELPGMDDHMVVRGKEIVDKFKRELEYLDFTHHFDLVTHIKQVDQGFEIQTKGGSILNARALIIASGAKQQKLNVPGEDQYLSRGLCYSAMSYAPLFIDKKTAVIGEGELALRSAAELATVADHVHLFGPSGQVMRSPLGVKLGQAKNVSILEQYKIVRVTGNGYCNQVVAQAPDGQEVSVSVDGTFIEMGLRPNTKFLENLVELNEEGFIKVDSSARTSLPGIFAAGDVTDSFAEQVLVAVGEGAKAALSAFDYLLPSL